MVGATLLGMVGGRRDTLAARHWTGKRALEPARKGR
jgi:hypothetical protein